MAVTLDDTKRTAIAAKLAEMTALQKLLIANEEKFISTGNDSDISGKFQDMLADDRKNLGILETTIIQYGVKSQPKATSTQMIEQIDQLMSGSELTFFEKVAQHELLKHKQAMTGILIHKCAQVVGADIEAAITPLNTVNFENRAHQEQLKGILEILGTRELTGKDPDQGLWARVQDAVVALTGVAGSVVSRSDDEMTIEQILRMDHTKANTLFMEIMGSQDTYKIQEYFGQLYKDLMAHSKAEEEVVYPAIRSFYPETPDLYEEQAQMARLLDEIKALNPSNMDSFKARVQDLQRMTQHHINQEENEAFPAVRNNCSHEQQKQLATQFKSSKSKFQDQMAASMK